MNLDLELQAVNERMRTWVSPQELNTMASATAQLAASDLSHRALAVGQPMPDFELPDATGQLIRSADLRAQTLLQRLDDFLPAATLVAISPQLPDYSLTTQQKHDLRFPVLSDVGNRVARQFGLVFTLDARLRSIYQSTGIDISQYNGDRSFELPVPATYLVSQAGLVLEAFVNVDYRQRLAPETALIWINRHIATQSVSQEPMVSTAG